MKRKVLIWQIMGFMFSSLGGVLLHFMYEWTNKSIFVAAFSAVNESIWEHMKLVYFPMVIFMIIQIRFFKEYENYLFVKLAGIISGLKLIPVLYYTYNGAFGKSYDWLNIAFFFISLGFSFILETYLFNKVSFDYKRKSLALIFICLIGLAFVVFTFAAPKLPLFQDAITGLYGIDR